MDHTVQLREMPRLISHYYSDTRSYPCPCISQSLRRIRCPTTVLSLPREPICVSSNALGRGFVPMPLCPDRNDNATDDQELLLDICNAVTTGPVRDAMDIHDPDNTTINTAIDIVKMAAAVGTADAVRKSLAGAVKMGVSDEGIIWALRVGSIQLLRMQGKGDVAAEISRELEVEDYF